MLNVIYLSLLSNRAESFEMEEDLEKIVTGAIDSSITILNEVKALNLNKVDIYNLQIQHGELHFVLAFRVPL